MGARHSAVTGAVVPPTALQGITRHPAEPEACGAFPAHSVLATRQVR
jgi:hypothetical protein